MTFKRMIYNNPRNVSCFNNYIFIEKKIFSVSREFCCRSNQRQWYLYWRQFHNRVGRWSIPWNSVFIKSGWNLKSSSVVMDSLSKDFQVPGGRKSLKSIVFFAGSTDQLLELINQNLVFLRIKPGSASAKMTKFEGIATHTLVLTAGSQVFFK